MAPLIKSLLQTDFYKFTMAQVVLHQFPAAWVKYKFKCRNGSGLPYDGFDDNEKYIAELNEQVDHVCTLSFTDQELAFLKTRPFFTADYLEYLRLLRLNRRYVKIYQRGGNLEVDIEGPWISTIWFEIYLLTIISSTYNKHRDDKPMGWTLLDEGRKRLDAKLDYLNEALGGERQEGPFAFYYADFGTRRAASPEWHENEVLPRLISLSPPGSFVGTSNVYLAMRYNLKAIGTMAHEYLQAFQQLGFRLVDAQKKALQCWANEYRGHLGIALTDVVGIKAFLNDFDLYFAKLFDGGRQDSGDPVWWGNLFIDHYKKLGVDPTTRSAVFSDSLNFPKAIALYREFTPRIRQSFGIGTDITNDLGVPAMSIVIKMVECNHRPVAKVSDSPGKLMCEDPAFVQYLKSVYGVTK